jgi:exonuclease VII small subunit
VNSGERVKESTRLEDKIKKLEELIHRLENIYKEFEKAEIPRKEEVLERLSDVIRELEDSVIDLTKPSEVEELREVSNLLRTLGDVARDVIGSAISKFTEMINGKRLGENIASLYTSLKSSGLPEQVIQDIIKEYTTRTLSAIPNIAELISKFFAMAEAKKKESRELKREMGEEHSQKEAK